MLLISDEEMNNRVQKNSTVEPQSMPMKKDPYLFDVRDSDALPCNITSFLYNLL